MNDVTNNNNKREKNTEFSPNIAEKRLGGTGTVLFIQFDIANKKRIQR